jgi:hypothetical protein
MQDFYILQRTSQPLNSEQVQKWFYTVEMLSPQGISVGDDDNETLMLAMQNQDFLYIIPFARHLTANEAERIVEGYLRVTEHDFEIEASNVYRADADFGHPFEYDIRMDEGAREVLEASLERQHHNRWINEKQNAGWRFGLNLNLKEKTHPAMRPWDDLPESYRRKRRVEDKELVDYYSKNINKFT